MSSYDGLADDSPVKVVPEDLGEEEEDKKPDGKALLQLGHDGLSGFTSLRFKMHETIR